MTATLEPFDDDDDDDDDRESMLVDQPAEPRVIDAQVLSARIIDKRPVVPGWMRDRAEFRAALAWLTKYGAHVSLYHGTRSPLYGARLIARSPIGGWRVARAVFRWVFDHEQSTVRADAVRRFATAEYLTLSRQRNDRVRRRGVVALGGFLLLAVAVVLAYLLAPAWSQAAMFVVVTGALGVVGTPGDKRVTDRATVSALAPPRLSAESVTRALLALGIGEMNKKGAVIAYPAPITRDGPGWRADVDLPHGVTPQDVMEKRRELASGLRRPLGCCWPEPAGDEHAGRLVLWVGDQDLAKSKQPAWPLARSGVADVFGPVPFGTDQRGHVVTVCLMFANMVIGSLPRVGKSFSLRLLLLAASLDVRVELHTFDLKGTGDLSPLAPVAHAYRGGDDVDDIEYALADMQALATELRRRTKVIQRLPRDLCPENKITPELAGRRALGLHPIVLGVDECQRWFENPRHGKELTAIAEDLVRRGPATGIIAIFATQKPDAKSLPTGISGNAILRFALKVMDHTANDMILGTSAHRNGIKATMFTRKDLGIGWLSGEADDPKITRTFYVDGPAAETVVTRARAMRKKAGTLSGYCLGDETTDGTPTHDLLADVRAVFATNGGDRIWHSELLAKLIDLRPDVYEQWDVRRLGGELRELGVATHQVAAEDATGQRVNRRGLRREDLEKVLANGGETPEIGP